VCAAYAKWFDIGVESEEETWVLLAGVRNGVEE
jgi:hypothetical protein